MPKPMAYLINRFLRIVPHFLVALVIAIVIHFVFHRYGMLRMSDREHPDLPTLHAFDFSNIAGNVLGFLPGTNRLLLFDFVDIIWAVRVEMVFYFAVFFVLLIPGRRRVTVLVPYSLIGVGLATVFITHKFGYAFFFFYGVLLYDHRRYLVSLVLCVLGMTLYFYLLSLHADANFHHAFVGQYLILAGLIAFMTWLAFKPSDRHAFDQNCGELSYPLYIHHQNMLIIMISLTAGYSYSVFVVGIALSLMASYGLMRLVDPAVNQLRDIIRGKRLERPEASPRRLGQIHTREALPK